MSSQLIITLVILAAALALFLRGKFSFDLVALLVLIALGLSRVLTPQEVFSGFSDTSVITILAVFVLAHGLEATGIADRMGEMLVRTSGGNETRLILGLMSSAAFMSLFMNNIAVASILLPAAATIAKKSNVKLSRLLMPLAFGTLLGGTATLFTTTNIVVSGVLKANGLRGFGVLDFAPVGLILVAVGIVYMALWGQKLLPPDSPAGSDEAASQQRGDLLSMYHLDERLFRGRIPPGSPLVDTTLAVSGLRENFILNVIAVERGRETILAPGPEFALHQDDILLLEGRLEEFRLKADATCLDIVPMRRYTEQDLESTETVILEVVLAPRSQLIGRNIKDAHFREKYGMTALAVWNGERVIRTRLAELKLAFGDALLLQGPREKLAVLRLDPDLIVLSSEEDAPRDVSNKAWLAGLIFLITIIVAALGRFSVSEVMLTGALVMVLVNVVTMEQVYRVVEWRIIFLVAGMLPLGLAMTKTGATSLFAGALTGFLQPYGPAALLLGLLLLTVLLSQAMKGAAVSAVIAPIAIQAAQQFHVDPRAMAMGVAVATSLAFVTPLGHPVNILMMGPGGYSFRDFFRVGLPLTILLVIVILLVLPVFWPFTP